MVSIARKLYQGILPFGLRIKIRVQIFKNFRRDWLYDFLRKAGFLIYKNYLIINSLNSKETLKINNEDVKIYQLLEKDKIKLAGHLEGQELDGLKPFVATTETVVLDISDCGFSFRNNHLLDKQLNVIGEVRTEKEQKCDPLPIYYKRLPRATKLKGTVAYLSNPDPTNYYHWMCRTLPLIRIYQKFFDLKEIDFFYVGQFSLSNFHIESLTKAGIALSKVTHEACTADRLLIAITNRSIEFGDPINKEAYFFSRKLFYDNSKFNSMTKKKRIYVKRGNVSRRKVINETQIITLLEKYGFEVVAMDNKRVQEQAEIFSQSEAIVAAHGAALTNLLFIQPGVKVIELIPYGYVNNCFYVMGSYGEADYFYLQGEKTSQNKGAIRDWNVCIDIQKLEKICQMAGLDKSSRR